MRVKSVVFFLGFVLGMCLNGRAQEKGFVTLSGYIKDKASGETLIGATVYVDSLKTGASTNFYGFYSLSIPKGVYEVSFSYVGYESVKVELELNENKTLDVDLPALSQLLDEVVVSDEEEDINIKSVEMSVEKLDIKTIEKIPAFLGEVDIIRAIQLLPGVSTVGEGATGFNVRGGGIDQNLVLLDEAPVYNSSHLFGFFSVFNPDAVKDVKLVKGGIPAQYGGRLSSIFDVRMKEGNERKFSVSGGVGTIFSRLTLEGPIVKDKASFILAGRRSYVDILAKPFLSDDFKDSKFFFYDLTLKTNYKLNKNNRLFASGYFGRDQFQFGSETKFGWGNSTATLRWNHLFNDRLFSNFTAYYSNYDYKLGFGEDLDKFDWESAIVNYSLKSDFSYFVNPDFEISFGGQGIFYDFKPAKAVAVSAGEVTNISLDNKYAIEAGFFVQSEQKIGQKLSLSYGLRWSYFNYIGSGKVYEFNEPETPGGRKSIQSITQASRGESIESYNNLEPRLALAYQLSSSSSLKASFNRMAQYIHLVSNTAAATPLDVWTPSTNNIDPQIGMQYVLGFFKNLSDNTYELSIEGYYKDLENQLDYVNGADLLINPALEGELLQGKGRAYGVELMAKKKKGKFSGWTSYTISRSERLVENVNQDEWFPTRFDQTHNLSVVANYDLNKKWSFSANFALISGTPTTLPTDRIEFQGYIIPHNSNYRRNNYRIPTYHRLDISATMQGKRKANRKNQDYWVFSIYNVYNNKNPFSVFFQQQEIRPLNGEPIDTQAVKFSIIGSIVPSIAYNFKF